MDNSVVPQQTPVSQLTISDTMTVTEQLRTKTYDLLAECLLKGLDNPNSEVFSVEDSEQSSDFILQRLEEIKTKDQLFLFLKQLTERWPIYHSAYIDLQKEDLMSKVQVQLDQLKGGTE